MQEKYLIALYDLENVSLTFFYFLSSTKITFLFFHLLGLGREVLFETKGVKVFLEYSYL